LAPIGELRRAVLKWGLCFALGLTAASWMFVAHLTRRLNAVGLAASRIRLGDVLTLMPRGNGEHELARMCRELDAMVANFRETQEKMTPPETHPGIMTEPLVKDRDMSKYV
jgi:hypothetical protein